MPSNTMKERMRKARQSNEELDEIMQGQEDQPDDEEQPDDIDNVDVDDDDQPDDEEQPEVDYKNKFERLRGKQSAMERENNELKTRNQELSEKIERNIERDTDKAEQGKTPKSDGSYTDDDIEQYLIKNAGGEDEWEYMDDTQKRMYRNMAKDLFETRKISQSINVKDQIDEEFGKQAKNKKAKEFTKKMDGIVAGIDPDANFYSLVNEPDFDVFLRSDRRMKALFIEASNGFDDDSVELMTQVVEKYLGNTKVETQDKKTPDVGAPSNKGKRRKKQTPSDEQIAWARRNLARASQRTKAIGILKKAGLA